MGSWNQSSSHRIASSLLRIGKSDTEGVADAVAQAWQRIDEGLKPIIGPAGVAALYQRSLHLRTVQHPWLAEVGDRSRRCVDAAPLRAALARLQPVDAPPWAATCSKPSMNC